MVTEWGRSSVTSTPFAMPFERIHDDVLQKPQPVRLAYGLATWTRELGEAERKFPVAFTELRDRNELT